ncbi:MAG: hypothetical protein IJQ02_14370 [Oscillospiraceae bacterium]|nr:hypothetical protein [Lachnospiraceae bacterium]MBR0162450.1 hypothetical protein [Oscillospiraceae bacterium]
MNPFFEQTHASWVKYSNYEWKKTADGTLYLLPARDAVPKIYNPIENAQQLVVDALNIGRMGTRERPDTEIQKAIMDFAMKYGLFGLMTALPTTSKFMDYEAVYLPKNPFIKAEVMDTMDYLALFFPFKKPNLVKRGVESVWTRQDDKPMMALMMTMSDQPLAVNMGFQREYAERYDWLKQQFKEWAFLFVTSVLYYDAYSENDVQPRMLLQQSMAAFDGNAPTYHIALLEKPTIMWNYHSLLLGIQLMFSFMLTDEKTPLRLCRHCDKVFVASRSSNQFCSPECKNRYNVYKTRARKNNTGENTERV